MTLPTRTVLVALLGLLALTACQPRESARDGSAPPGEQRLTIVGSDWNGWDRDHRPTPETKTLPVEVGATVSLRSIGGPLVLEVVSTGDGEVALSSDSRLAPEGDTGGSNLNDLTDAFTVVEGTETSLATPTMDAGYSYELTLESVG